MEESIRESWLTGVLTAHATNAPKTYPKLDDLIRKAEPPKPMGVEQWTSMLSYLLGHKLGEGLKKKKKKRDRQKEEEAAANKAN